LGAPLVAVLGGAKSTRSVRQWASGDTTPTYEQRLRFVLQVADVLLTREQPDVVRAWFSGQEPNLDDANPLMLIVEKDDARTRAAILDAARQFIAET
jgi:hypothetical protein